MKLVFYIIVMSSLCLSLIACDTVTTYAPVTALSVISPLPKTGMHQVRKGETLYEIAWQYGLDYRYLAARNHIEAPYAIHIGQTISLRGEAKPIATPRLREARSSLANQSATIIQNPVNPSAYPLPKTKPPVVEKKLVVKAISPEPDFAISKWLWPTKAKIHHFSRGDKGINIYGEKGAPIYAAGSGKVVYAGGGLRGYGNLIILKHNSLYLSAYAHNRVILVKEGNWVRQGQKIAEMGNTGTDQIMLHFEIRKSGRPINPVALFR